MNPMPVELLQFLEHLPDAVMIGLLVEENGPADVRVDYVNSRFEKLSGARKDELIGLLFTEISVVKPDFPGLGKERLRIYENAGRNGISGRFEHCSGEPSACYTVSVSAMQPGSFICLFHEIPNAYQDTDLLALRQSEERFRILAELTSDAATSVTLQPDGSFRRDWATESLVRSYGYTWEDLGDFQKWSKIVYPPDLQIYVDGVKQLQQGKKVTVEFRIVTRKGEVRWIENTVYPRVDPQTGKPIGLLSAVRDINERKVAEQKLRFTQFTVDHAGDMVFWINDAGYFVYVNEAVTRNLGYADEEIKTLRIFDVDANLTEASREELWEKLERDSSSLFETELKTRSGRLVPVEVNCNLFAFEGKRYTISYIRDITQRKKAEENQLKNQRLESLGILAGGIAHDFNNLLTGICGYVDLSRMELPEGHPAREPLDKSMAVFQRAKDLASQLLTFSRGGITEITRFQPSERLVEDTRFALSGSDVQVEFDIDPGLWMIEASQNQLDQVYDNIVINAKQSMSVGGKLKVSARNVQLLSEMRRTIPPGRYVRIEFSDNGPGIPPEALSRIFDPFFTTRDSGNGLGLATVYSIIKKHGGFIEAVSEPGQGATFIIHLPAVS